MKLKELTKKQRASIEADEIGNKLIDIDEGFVNMNYTEYIIRKNTIHDEIKRTIKRIDDEIEFLKPITNVDNSTSNIIILGIIDMRIIQLQEQKNLYELMEKLE